MSVRTCSVVAALFAVTLVHCAFDTDPSAGRAVARDSGVDAGEDDVATVDSVSLDAVSPDAVSIVFDADASEAASCKCGDVGCCPGAPISECCPGGACPVLHDTGLGPNYWYCGPLGASGKSATYTKTMAEAAAKSWGPGQGQSGDGTSTVTTSRPEGTSRWNACWIYSGPNAGRTSFCWSPGDPCPKTLADGGVSYNKLWN